MRTAMMCMGRWAGMCESRSRRSSSRTITLGSLSLRPYSISGGVHHAFMPTTAAPRDTVAQYATTHSG